MQRTRSDFCSGINLLIVLCVLLLLPKMLFRCQYFIKNYSQIFYWIIPWYFNCYYEASARHFSPLLSSWGCCCWIFYFSTNFSIFMSNENMIFNRVVFGMYNKVEKFCLNWVQITFGVLDCAFNNKIYTFKYMFFEFVYTYSSCRYYMYRFGDPYKTVVQMLQISG